MEPYVNRRRAMLNSYLKGPVRMTRHDDDPDSLASQMSHGACDASHAACGMLHGAWRYLECNPVVPAVVEYRRLV